MNHLPHLPQVDSHIPPTIKELGAEQGDWWLSEYGSVRLQAMINIAAPDDILLQDFKKWIHDSRAELGLSMSTGKVVSGQKAGKPLTETEMNSWRQNHLLPFIDLCIYFEFVGERPSNIQLMSFLTEDQFARDGIAVDLGSKYQYTKQMAASITSDRNLARLWVEAHRGDFDT